MRTVCCDAVPAAWVSAGSSAIQGISMLSALLHAKPLRCTAVCCMTVLLRLWEPKDVQRQLLQLWPRICPFTYMRLWSFGLKAFAIS